MYYNYTWNQVAWRHLRFCLQVLFCYESFPLDTLQHQMKRTQTLICSVFEILPFALRWTNSRLILITSCSTMCCVQVSLIPPIRDAPRV